MRCLPAPLRCGAGRPRCPHRSDAGTEIRDSVNEAKYFIYGNLNDNFDTHDIFSDNDSYMNKYTMKINKLKSLLFFLEFSIERL